MSDPLLSDINLGDTEGTKFAKLQRWLTLLANNIGGGGGGGGVTKILAGTNIILSPTSGLRYVTVNAIGSASNAYATVTNNSGNTIVTPTQSNYDLAVSLTGVASTRIFGLAVAGRSAGDRCRLLFTLPATANIVIEVRNNNAVGTLLLPADLYASQQLTTDGSILSAILEFEYTGSAWRYVDSQLPA